MVKTKTLDFSGYEIRGAAAISMWGGGEAVIKMDDFTMDKIGLHKLIENINDGGFGCESIDGAIVDIYETYGGVTGLKEYKKSIIINIKNRLSDKQEDMLINYN